MNWAYLLLMLWVGGVLGYLTAVLMIAAKRFDEGDDHRQ